MPKCADIHSVFIIGAGPIVIARLVFGFAISYVSFVTAAEPTGMSGSYLVYPTHDIFCARPENAAEVIIDEDAAGLLKRLVRVPDCHAITLLPGDYPMKKALHLKSGLSLFGQSGARLLQKNNGDLIIGSSITNCRIVGLELVGNKERFTGAAMAFQANCKSNSFSGLYIHDFGGDGLSFNGATTQYNSIISNRVENCMGAGIGHYWAAGDALIEDNFVCRTRFHGIIVSRGGSRCRIADNTVVEAGYYLKETSDFAHGIAVDGSGVVHGTGNVIIGNVISNSAMAGIEVADFQDNCAIIQNKVFVTGRKHYGIYFGGGLTPSTNALIATNLVQDAAGSGIRVDSPLSGEKGITSQVTITGNTIRDSTGSGILIGLATKVSVIGNVCQDNAKSSGSGDGIFVRGRGMPSQDITLTGNRCFDDRVPPFQGYGIFLINVSGVRVSGNILKPNKDGTIHQREVSGATITDNF